MTITAFDIAPGVIKDNTELLAEGFWTDADKVRFRIVGGRSQPEVIGGQQRATDQTIQGVCRSMHAWENLDGEKRVALGTHTTLHVFGNDFLWNITPFQSDATLNNAIATSASTTISITHTAHGLLTGDKAYLHNAVTVDGIALGVTATLSSNPFLTQSGSSQLTVNHPSHALGNGDVVIFAGATAVGGITGSAINQTHSILRFDANSYAIDLTEDATSSVAGGGTPTLTALRGYTVTKTSDDVYTVEASSAATGSTPSAGGALLYKYEIPIGLTKKLGSGYSSGGYSEGGYSGYTKETETNPRIWALSNMGANLVANYRKSEIYRWTGVLSQRAAVNAATDAPAQSLHHVVTPERFLMMLGTEDQATSTFDPMLVAWATQEGGFATGDWTITATNTAGQFRLAEGALIRRGLSMPFVTLIWTDTALYQAQYLQNSTFVWGFFLLGAGAGLIGSNAAARGTDGGVYWLSSNREFMAWRGGAPQIVPCPVRDWLFDLLEPNQEELIYAGLNDKFGEIWWFFPDSDAGENSRYVAYNYLEGHWTIGTFAITAWVGRGVRDTPLAAYADGSLKIQEYGATNDGAAFTAYAETSLFDAAAGDRHVLVKRMIPDFAGLQGSVDVTIVSRLWPTDDDTTTSAGSVNTSTQKLDFRVTARHIGVKLQSSTTPNAWRMGRLLLDVVPTMRSR